MKKILVPVDIPGGTVPAIKYASEYASAKGAAVYLFHAAPLPDFYVSDLEDYSKYEKEFKAVIKRIHGAALAKLQDIKSRYFDTSVKVVCRAVLARNVYNEILGYSEELKPEIIIMGEGDGSGRIKIGANTERVIRLTKIPVLVVKKEAKAKVKKVVFASEFRKNAADVFRKIMEHVDCSGVQVRLLYVNTKSDFEEYDTVKERIEKFKKNFSCDFSIVIRAGISKESSIVKYADSISADLIAMGIKRKKSISLYFTDRVTEGVINMTDIPVFVINEQA
ncbi:MAG: universal stress protein [Bacteroidetes bacterium]|nr:universal stress protein [Bacteroidota bacterium]